jgi:hypothetical protein
MSPRPDQQDDVGYGVGENLLPRFAGFVGGKGFHAPNLPAWLYTILYKDEYAAGS